LTLRRLRLATLYAAAATGFGLLLVPLAGLSIRAPWGSALELLQMPAIRSAIWLSLTVSSAAVATSLVLGFPLAWLLARTNIPGKRLLRTVLTLPMVLPPVVAGVALLAAFGRYGLLGASLDAVGIRLPFTTLAAILAATFVSAPLLITSLESALIQAEVRFEQVAATLGASPSRTFWMVLIPSIRPALLAGLALCWARALGEFGATITFAGNLEGRTQTVPLAIYQLLQSRPQAALLLGAILLAVSVLVLATLRGHRPTA
jgi:molybdate transport system permease protein